METNQNLTICKVHGSTIERRHIVKIRMAELLRGGELSNQRRGDKSNLGIHTAISLINTKN